MDDTSRDTSCHWQKSAQVPHINIKSAKITALGIAAGVIAFSTTIFKTMDNWSANKRVEP